jgi:tetratricopeptide (TPR) repeat protein
MYGYKKPIPVDEKEAEQIYFKFQVEFLGKFLKTNPNHLHALQDYGHALTHLGRHKEALEVDYKLTQLMPDDPIARYNLACDYSNLNMIEKSLEALEKAIKLGYNDFEFMKSDPDLENLRKDDRFYKLIEKYQGGYIV